MKKSKVIFRQGNKVILRPVEETDLPLFQKWMNDYEVTQYLRQIFPVSMEDQKDWLQRNLKQSNDKVTLALVDRKTKKLIGSMGLHSIDYIAGTAITGSVIGDKKYWGKGYGTEAKMMLLEFAFNELNLRKIYSYVIAYNERSLAYAKTCGYVEEARIPDHYSKGGKFWDQIILAVYRTSWEKLWKNYSKKSAKKIIK